MKKIVIVLSCLFLMGLNVFASEEAFLNLGPSFRNIFHISGDNIHAPGASAGFIGIGLDTYGFWNNNNVGLFVLLNYLIPVYRVDDNTEIEKYSSSFNSSYVLGPGFRHIFNNRLTLLGGLGLDIDTQRESTDFRNGSSYENTFIDLGIAGQAAIKFDMSDILCIMLRTNVSYTFITYSEKPSEWTLKSKAAVSPFIGIGLNMYDYKYSGKPEPKN